MECKIKSNKNDLFCTEDELKSFHKKVGKRVQKIRQDRNLSQLELSYLIGYKSTSLIAGAEAGYKNVKFSMDHLFLIAKALHVDIKEFFDFVNDEKF